MPQAKAPLASTRAHTHLDKYACAHAALQLLNEGVRGTVLGCFSVVVCCKGVSGIIND